jgi:biopolymer transport protein TolQ
MVELGNIAKLIADADVIIKVILVVLLFQSVYIWYAVIQFAFRSKRTRGDRGVMQGALADSNIDNVRRVLLDYSHFRSSGAPVAGTASEAESEAVFEDVWTEIYDFLTARCSGLSTIAATAPFIGLFGTVWGILLAFSSVRSAEAISFSALAPAIGEALFATLAGLFVAIPSVIANNWIASRSASLSRQCAHAYMELIKELRHLGRKPGTGEW